MGEEEKKPAEDKKPAEEGKKEEAPPEKPAAPAEEPKEGGEAKEGKAEPAPPPEIVLRVYMHCEGCARKVRRCLRGFEGVEDVITDCKSSKVVVKGEKADPLKVLERVQKKSHRKVELLSPIPKPSAEEEKKPEEKDQKPKPEENIPEPEVITVVLKVYMHCEACAQEIKKRILRMKGVESAEPDLKGSQVAVKGVFEAEKLVEYVYKRTGKHASVVKQEPEKKKEGTEKSNDAKKEEKKADGGGEKDKKESGPEPGSDDTAKKDGGVTAEAKPASGEESAAPADSSAATVEETTTKVMELRRNEYHYYPPRYPMELYAPPPQIFSDENPNACTVM